VRFRVDPECMPVDEPTELRVAMALDRSLGVGDSVAFALPESWSSQRGCVTFTKQPQCTDAGAPDYATVAAEGAEFDLGVERVAFPTGHLKAHVRKIVARIAEGGVKAGQEVTLRLRNFRATWLAESAQLRAWVNEQEVEAAPALTTVPAEAERLRVIVPSSARPGEPFEINIVSLDQFWNRSSSTFGDGVLMMQDGMVLEEGIAFTGGYRTRVAIDQPGISRLRFGEELSNPVRIGPHPCGPYWGDLHSHDKTHNCGAGEDPYTYAREVSCLDFLAVTPDYRGLCEAAWKEHIRRANAAYEPGRFTTIIGYEAGLRPGHHNVYFGEDTGEQLDADLPRDASIDAVLQALDPASAFAVPHHVGVGWGPQQGYRSERDPWLPLLEIYSQHGLGEFHDPEHILSYEYNRTRGLESKYATSVAQPVYARDAWHQGRRFGVIASSDDHMAQPGKPVKGLAAVFAAENTREALFAGLKARRTYGTTGERVLIDLRINGAQMGEAVSVNGRDALAIEIEVHGTGPLSFIELMRLRFAEGAWETAFAERVPPRATFGAGDVSSDFDYQARLEEAFRGDVVYYLRVGQQRQLADWPVFAWSSPIWVTGA
jgi:hypothetical protein